MMTMMMMQSGLSDLTKQRMMQAKALSNDVTGGLNLGKKMSVPRDVMMEELNLPSNRGSRMFQERQKRAEKFTLENVSNGAYNSNNVQVEAIPQTQISLENQAYPVPGKHSLVVNLQKTIAKMGSPDVLAPGYSGPLKDIPQEKFNSTVIPKSYCSPWMEALGNNDELLNTHLPQLPQRLQPADYRCFNRSAAPFGGALVSQRVIPVVRFEAVESQNVQSFVSERICRRPNFNRAPRGWGMDYNPESNEL